MRMKEQLNKIRVLHVVNWLNRGGIESYLLNIIRNYDKSRFQMDFCCRGKSLGEMTDEVVSLGSQVLHCRMGINLPKFINNFQKLLCENSYDIVNSHACDLSAPILYSARKAGVKILVSSYHNIENTSAEAIVKKMPFLRPFRNFLISFFHQKVIEYSTVITGCSGASLDAHFYNRDIHNPKFRVMYYGVECGRFKKQVLPNFKSQLNIPAGHMIVGHVGRFNEPKDHFTFVKAAKSIFGKFKNVSFLLVGDGYLKPEIEAYVKKTGLEKNFVFTGIRSDVPNLLSVMDVMLFPSIAEGLGLALIEAQAASLPIVASDLPSLRETICPGLKKYLTPTKSFEEFANKVLMLLENSAERERLGKEGLAFVEDNFSIQAATKKLENLYEELVTSNETLNNFRS